MKATSRQILTNRSRARDRRVSQRVLRLAAHVLAASSCMLPGCHQSRETSTDGETHFLRACSEECGSELACICGVCTLPCGERQECQALSASAECVPIIDRSAAAACPNSPSAAICDLLCTTDDNCVHLSPSYRCLTGFCRTTTDMAIGDASTLLDSPDGASCKSGPFASSEVLVLGDSFLAQRHQVTAHLEEMAIAAGSLTAGEHFRDNSSNTDNTLASGELSIANQYAKGKAEDPVKVVIMDGGIADLALGRCDTSPKPDCPVITDLVADARELLSQMAQDGVGNVIWFFYPDPPDTTLRDKVDVSRPLLADVCKNSVTPCHWLDLRPMFDGHYSEYTEPVGYPTDAGAKATAAAIWATMQQSCIVP